MVVTPVQASGLPHGTREAVAAIGVCLAAAIALTEVTRPLGLVFPLLALATYAAVAATVIMQAGAYHPHRHFGGANAVTLSRGAASSFLAGFVAERFLQEALLSEGELWAVLSLAVPTIMLDALDGHLARKAHQTSRFGARFDMEIDALLLLVLSGAAAATHRAGPWVLLIGSMRYVFWAAGALLPWLTRPLPPSLRRKAVCVAAFVLVSITLAPIVPAGAAGAIAAMALVLLLWSFAIDIAWTWRRRAEAPAPQ